MERGISKVHYTIEYLKNYYIFYERVYVVLQRHWIR